MGGMSAKGKGFCIPSMPTQSSSQSGESSRENANGTVDNLSLLCWGFWQSEVVYRVDSRPIKEILWDQIKLSGNWYSEPQVSTEVWCMSSQEMCIIDGFFRHKLCHRFSKVGFKNLTCDYCKSIPQQADFKGRVIREFRALEKRGTCSTGGGHRLDYLTFPEMSYNRMCS